MSLKDFLLAQTWVVYRINAEKRQFFGDTAFGPMWKDFPDDVVIPEGLVLDSLKSIRVYITEEQSCRDSPPNTLA